MHLFTRAQFVKKSIIWPTSFLCYKMHLDQGGKKGSSTPLSERNANCVFLKSFRYLDIFHIMRAGYNAHIHSFFYL